MICGLLRLWLTDDMNFLDLSSIAHILEPSDDSKTRDTVPPLDMDSKDRDKRTTSYKIVI